MGNATVAPAKSRAPIIPITPTTPRTSVSVFNPDSPITSRASFNSPTFAFPLASTTENIYDIPPIPTTSPTFAFPVVSPTLAISVDSPVPAAHPISPTTAIPIESLNATIPVEPPIAAIPPTPELSIISSRTIVPVNSPIPATPIVSSTTVFPVHSPIPAIPIVSPTQRVSATSPITVVPVNTPIPAVPATSFSPDIPIHSPIYNINGFPVISPDTSAVSPTLDLPATPIASPVPTDVILPVKPVIFSSKDRYAARITHDASTSPMVSAVPNTPAMSTISRPTEVASKQIVSKNVISPPASPIRQTKTSALSSADRWFKWNQFEQKQQEKQKKFTHTAERTNSLTESTKSLSKTNNTNLNIIPVVPNIIPVPSFSLRSTAVCNPSQDHHLLSERTQSIHTDLSIFKYYLTYNEAKYSIGDHTKATMFKMDTRLKQTPLPVPCLSFLTKNFSDGTNETNDKSAIAPSFGSLGLQHDFETEPIDQSSTALRIHEKRQQQRKLRQPSLFVNDATDSNNSLQFVTSTIMSQPDFSTIDQTFTQNNHQPLTSILKKPSSQFNTNPFSTETNNIVFQEFQKNDSENNPSIVSFNILPSSLRKKANQSISRSEKLIHRKK